jgi:hypothetical protein
MSSVEEAVKVPLSDTVIIERGENPSRMLPRSELYGSFDQYPTKRGDYEIQTYLLDYNGPKQGCWVDGETVYGNIYIGDQNWGTYTRPVFAYLQYIDTTSIPQNVTQQYGYEETKGHTRSFEVSVSTKYSVGGAIDIVNVSSEISVGFTASEAWSTTSSASRSTTLTGPGTFVTYQIMMVYAHNATSAGRKCSGAFEYNKKSDVGGRSDLYYLSAIALDKSVVVDSSKAINPLTWNQIQQQVLMQNYNPDTNSGHFGFDWSAYSNPYRRY